ncbi:Zinc-binding alcohol dehydrogenase domain-containing protein 2 [Acipenser ruthenus]|uniref:15-oxoprostaglandin 13-reductase n=1 Tax=Acipenser ruthenus TaxID=7906 RepID=A0A444U365_ACIRT|nr:Zinc-binding alcohol dehydrogenase domain-containing protein 2 [Acipenser ruthenus]
MIPEHLILLSTRVCAGYSPFHQYLPPPFQVPTTPYLPKRAVECFRSSCQPSGRVGFLSKDLLASMRLTSIIQLAIMTLQLSLHVMLVLKELVSCASEKVPVPTAKPEFLTLILSGATAYISLKKLGALSEVEKVFVTAAAGGTGQFAVQFAKRAKCHVTGTCSSNEKAGFLKSIGCDRPINYKTEDIQEVLRKENPKGLDVVYESISGELFDLAINRMATKGQLIVIGFISGYQTATGIQPVRTGTLPAKLLQKSASILGFFLPHYLSEYKAAMKHMLEMCEKGELVCEVDLGEITPEGKFVSLESVFRAVDYLYLGKNIGKIVVELPHSVSSKL